MDIKIIQSNIHDSFVLSPIDEADLFRKIDNLTPTKMSESDIIDTKLLKLDHQIYFAICYN